MLFFTQALFSSLVGRHSPLIFLNSRKLFSRDGASSVSCTGFPVREKPRRSHLILPIPMLVHLTGSVLDEDAPFGSSVLHAIHVVTGWHGSCREPID
jgi:hypothetical protein